MFRNSVLSTSGVQLMNKKLRSLFAFLLLAAPAGHAAISEEELMQHPVYQKLTKVLASYEKIAHHPWPEIKIQKPLEVGTTSPAVVLVKKRLQITGELGAGEDANSPIFDEGLKNAVSTFQMRHGLKSDGIVGGETLYALNVTPKQRIHQLQVNLKRWAQFIEEEDPQYVWINIPDYYLRVVDHDHTALTSRVIVGKVSRATPEVDSHIKQTIVNPTWTVPPGILKKDIVPRIIADPKYLSSHRMHIYFASKPSTELSRSQINMADLRSHPLRYMVRQDPGPQNALGQIKFDFNNPHSVYVHDTPTKELFEQEKRLFSSGCVRLENPLLLLDELGKLDQPLQAQMGKIKTALQSRATAAFRLGKPFPIHITYITAWVDDSGGVHFLDDVYQHGHHIVRDAVTPPADLPTPDYNSPK